VTYGISGSMSSPSLNVNPLSPFAPGILRKIFMVGVGERSAGPAGQQQPTFSPER
jgi:hypothetical protein